MPVGKNERNATKVVCCVLLLLFVFAGRQTAAQSKPDASVLSSQKAVIERWLEETRLADKLEVIKLRLSTHPDSSRGDRQGYRLELRFKTDGTETEAQAQEEFQKFLGTQATASGRPFPEEMFYKVIHLLGITRESASVHFYVFETEYAVYFNVTTRELVLDAPPNRGSGVRRTLSVKAFWNGSATGSAGSGTVAKTIRSAAAKQKELPQTIRKFLEDFFHTAKTGDLPEPKLVWQPQEDEFLGVSVSGLKGQIIDSKVYWEKLLLSIELKPGQNEVKLQCNFDGLYASGIGSNQPADDSYYLISDKNFGSHLNAYADKVLSSLQQYLQKEQR
jgi:hypothetical protein